MTNRNGNNSANLHTNFSYFFTRLKKEGLNRIESSASSVLLEFFSGFEFVSLSPAAAESFENSKYFWYSSRVDSGVVLHVNKVFFRHFGLVQNA